MRSRVLFFARQMVLFSLLAATETLSAQSSTPGLYDPVADPAAVVLIGKARFTVLTPQLIRMEWAADGRLEDRASFVFLNRRLPVPGFSCRPDCSAAPANKRHAQPAATPIVIDTGALQLQYTPTGDGHFTSDNLSIALSVAGKPVVWRPGQPDTGNLLGTTRTLDGARGSKTEEPIEPGLLSRAGWTVVDDSARPLFDAADFRFQQGEKSPWPWVQLRPAGARQDLYFFGYGHDYRKALADFVQVAGRIPLPPRFAFGAWWSRYWDYSDQQLEELLRGFHQNNVPLDVLVIDMGWHISYEQLAARGEKDQSGEELGWSGYTWNASLFPDPEGFLKKMHAEGLKVTLNLHPASGIQPWEQAYPAMASAMGIDPATRQYVPFNITDKKFATNSMNLVHHPLERQGVDFWWLDWQQEQKTALAGVAPIWWLNYVHFTDQQRQGKRPLLFHRWGGLGNHRYQIGFSGDTFSVWESLDFQPWFTATAANVGYAYWSHDIGGHMPGAVDPELYTRWVEFGAYSPILRTHTTQNPAAERRVWAYPEPYASILRATFQMRSALEPYLYTEARRTYDTGVAFLHPLYYDWPEDDAAYTMKNEYVFGSQMIAAPVTKPVDKLTQLARQPVWIPAGDWIETPTGRHFTGPAQLDRSFSIEQTPVYVRAGAIVPLQPAMRYSGEKPVDPLILNLWPLAVGASSSYTLYEDSGHAVDYQKGVAARTPIHAAEQGDLLRVVIGAVEGSYPGMPARRGYQLRLPADWPPAAVTVNGVVLRQADVTGRGGWSYDGNTLTTIVPVAARSLHQATVIEVRRAHELIERRPALDGFAGSIVRLRAAHDAIMGTWPIAKPPDALTLALQTGDRLSYHPENAAQEVEKFASRLHAARAALQALEPTFAGKVDDYIRQSAGSAWSAVDISSSEERQKRIDAMTRALRLAEEAGK